MGPQCGTWNCLSVPEPTEQRRKQRLGEGDDLPASGRRVTRGPRPRNAPGLLLLHCPLGSRVCQGGLHAEDTTPPRLCPVALASPRGTSGLRAAWLSASQLPPRSRPQLPHLHGGLRLSRKKGQCSQSLRPLPAPRGCGSATASLSQPGCVDGGRVS